MKKKLFLLGGMTVTAMAYSQVGILTENPKSTLDITAKNTTGKSTNTDGLLIPRVDRERALSMSSVESSTLIYINNISTGTATGKASNIDSVGFYYFDGIIGKWVKLNTNSFSGDPTPDAFVDDSINGIVKLGTTSSTTTRAVGADFAIKDNGNVGIGTLSPIEKLDVRNGNGRFEGDNSRIPTVYLHRSYGGANLPGGQIIGKYNFSGIVGASNQYLSGIRSVYWGTGSNVSSDLRFSVNGENNLNMVLNPSGYLGIGNNITPSQRLDVDGTARLRNIPNGSEDDKILIVDGNGVIKKRDLDIPPTPSFALYATSTQSVLRNADNVARPLAINTTNKIYNNYIERVDGSTFKVKKNGIYTIEVWAKYTDVPIVNTDDRRSGCRVVISAGGENVQQIGDRWEDSKGSSSINKTVLLNNGNTISVNTGCIRTGNQQYRTAPGSSIFITYMPL